MKQATNGQGRVGRGLRLGVGLVLLAWLSVLVAYQVPAAYRVDLAAARANVEAAGIYAPEHDAVFGDFRWTGATTVLHLRPIGAPLQARVTLAGWRPAGVPNPTVVFQAGGRELGRIATSNISQTVTLTIPVDLALLTDLSVTLTSDTFRAPGDPRLLGVILTGLAATSAPAWPAPLVPPRDVLAFFLALTGLAAFIGGRLGGGVRSAFGLAGAVVIATAVPHAFDRAFIVQYDWALLTLALAVALVAAYEAPLALTAHRLRQAIGVGRVPVWNTYPTSQAIVYVAEHVSYTRVLSGLLVAASVLIVLLHLAAPLLPAETTPYSNNRWGVDFYSALPAPLAWGLALAILAFMVPTLNRRVLDGLAALAGRWRGRRMNPWQGMGVAALGAMAGLWLLRTRTSLGDSAELLRKIAAHDLWREREPLDYYLHYKLSWALAPLGVTPAQVYIGLALLAGGLVVVGVLLLAGVVAPPGRRWVVAGLGLATGNLLLFAGYIESYSLNTAAAVWFLYAAVLYAGGRLPGGIPAAILGLAVWLHPETAFLAPALLVAWLVHGLRAASANQGFRAAGPRLAREAGVLILAGLLPALLVVTVFLLEGYSAERWALARAQVGGQDGRTFKPLLVVDPGSDEYYPILSLDHLAGVTQQQLLLTPLAGLTILGAGWAFRRRFGAVAPALGVLAAGAAGAFMFSVVWNPDLGPRTDWDLLALPGIPEGLLAGALLACGWPATDAARFRYIASVLVAVSAWHALTWLLVHAFV